MKVGIFDTPYYRKVAHFEKLCFYVIHLISKFPQRVKLNFERLDMGCVVGVKVVVDSHKAVTDHTQKKQQWQKDHL